MSDVPPSYPPPPPPPGGGYPPPPPGGAGYGGPPLAELGPRVVAFLIDRVAIPIGLYVATFILAIVLGAVSDALGALVFLLGWLAQLGYGFGYLPYMEGTTGQSIGKKMQGTRLVSLETGQPVGFGMAFARAFINGLPCNLGWVLGFFDNMRQTLGDKVSKSVTIAA